MPPALDLSGAVAQFRAMCGRFALTATPEEVEAVFGLAGIEAFPPRYNIAPTQPVLIVTAGPVPDATDNTA